MKTDNKKALTVFSTDWHLKTSNIETIKDLITQQCELALELEVDTLVCLGDVFDSRIAQREDVLTAFGQILDIIGGYDLTLWLIPGNHDKTSYNSYDSFLTPYKYHPNLHLVYMAGSIPFVDSKLHLDFLPFFSEQMWLDKFNEFTDYIDFSSISKDEKHILCTHIAVTGSKNNDGTMVSSTLSTSLFKQFYKVFSGHYHDQQQIGSNFYHIPSIQQNNFGENSDKGFTVLYEDGSHKLVKSKFKEYVKVKIDLDSVTTNDINDLKKKYKGSDNNIRFEVTGSENVLKSLRKEEFSSLGIELKTKVKEIQTDIEYSESAEVVEHTSASIKEVFEKFCEKELLDVEVGMKYLNKKL